MHPVYYLVSYIFVGTVLSVYSEAMEAVALVIRQLPSYLGIGVNPSRQWLNVLLFDHSRLQTLEQIQPLILNPYFALLYLRVKPQVAYCGSLHAQNHKH